MSFETTFQADIFAQKAFNLVCILSCQQVDPIFLVGIQLISKYVYSIDHRTRECLKTLMTTELAIISFNILLLCGVQLLDKQIPFHDMDATHNPLSSLWFKSFESFYIFRFFTVSAIRNLWRENEMSTHFKTHPMKEKEKNCH